MGTYGSEGKASACSAGDLGGSGRSPEEGKGNPLQYSCLENLKNGGAWWATVHGVTKSQTRLRDFTFTFTFKQNTTALSGVPLHKKAVMYPTGKTTTTTTNTLDKLQSDMSYSAIGRCFNINESSYILNMVSLNRNTHKMKLCIVSRWQTCDQRLEEV